MISRAKNFSEWREAKVATLDNVSSVQTGAQSKNTRLIRYADCLGVFYPLFILDLV